MRKSVFCCYHWHVHLERSAGLKRLCVLICACAIPALLLAGAAGCGGDAGKARFFMQSGDSELSKMKPIAERLSSDTTRLFEGVFAGGKVDTAGFKRNGEAVLRDTDELAGASEKAGKQYQAIGKLKDVPGYKKYADVRIEALSVNEEALSRLNAFVEEWTTAMAAPGFDPVSFVGAARELSARSSEASAAIDKLEKEASALKKSSKL